MMPKSLLVRLTLPLSERADHSGGPLVFSKWLPIGQEAGLSAERDGYKVTLWFDIGSVQWASEIKREDISRYVNLHAHRIHVDVATENIDASLLEYMAGLDFSRTPTADEAPLAEECEREGQRLLTAVETVLNTFLAFVRTEKGQYWATPYVLQSQTMESDPVVIEGQASVDGGEWFRWVPSRSHHLTAVVPADDDPRMLREMDWEKAQEYVSAGKRSDLTLELLAGAERRADTGDERAALTEAVSALEVAFRTFAKAPAIPISLPTEYSSRITSQSIGAVAQHLGLTASVSFLFPLLFPAAILPGDVLTLCREAITARQNVAHQGQRSVPVAQLTEYLGAVRSVCELLLRHVAPQPTGS